MANVQQVKQYLAYWFQVGKPLIVPQENRQLLPSTITAGENYTSEFNAFFDELLSPRHDDSYLEGSPYTLKELLSSRWSLSPCARCTMPIPVDNIGLNTGCPCADLEEWPNLDLPLPHCPNNVREQLTVIHQRLHKRLLQYG